MRYGAHESPARCADRDRPFFFVSRLLSIYFASNRTRTKAPQKKTHVSFIRLPGPGPVAQIKQPEEKVALSPSLLLTGSSIFETQIPPKK